MKLRLSDDSFEWDNGNRGKNLKHNVTDEEAEEAFFDPKARFRKTRDGRHALLGRTEEGRYLLVIFLHGGMRIGTNYDVVRIISARDMTRTHRKFYREKAG